MGVSKTSDHIQMKIKIQYSSQEHPASSKALNQDFKCRDVLCIFNIKIKSRNLEHGSPMMGVSKTSDHIQVKVKMSNPSKETPASSKAPNQEFKDIYVLYNFKIKEEIANSEHGSTKDQ